MNGHPGMMHRQEGPLSSHAYLPQPLTWSALPPWHPSEQQREPAAQGFERPSYLAPPLYPREPSWTLDPAVPRGPSPQSHDENPSDALSSRGSRHRDSHRESRQSNEERVNRASKRQFYAQECPQGFRETRRTDRENRGRDLPVWMNNTLKNLSYDGSTEWETFIHRFRLVSDQMGLSDPERAEFLVSTLQADAFKAILYAQRAKGDLSFKEICSRLESRYEGDFSMPAAAWMELDQAFQQRNESLFQWSDRLNRIGDSISRLDVGGRSFIETRLVSKFCFAAWDRETGVKAMEQGPPKTLEEAVESVRWYQHVHGAAVTSGAERPRAHVRGWSPDRDSWDRHNRRGDTDSRYERYRDRHNNTRHISHGRRISEGTRGPPVQKTFVTVNE